MAPANTARTLPLANPFAKVPLVPNEGRQLRQEAAAWRLFESGANLSDLGRRYGH